MHPIAVGIGWINNINFRGYTSIIVEDGDEWAAVSLSQGKSGGRIQVGRRRSIIRYATLADDRLKSSRVIRRHDPGLQGPGCGDNQSWIVARPAYVLTKLRNAGGERRVGVVRRCASYMNDI